MLNLRLMATSKRSLGPSPTLNLKEFDLENLATVLRVSVLNSTVIVLQMVRF